MRWEIHVSGGDITELNSLAAALAASPVQQSEPGVDTTATSVTSATGDAATATAPAAPDPGTTTGSM